MATTDLTGRSAGDYDVFSTRIAAQCFESVFCSGYSYAASAYGLPDVGYVNWRDMTDFAAKIRHAIPASNILVVEAIRVLETISRLRSYVSVPVMVNQLHGGKSPNWRFDELEDAGASIVICSTPCLFAAQYGIERYLDRMLEMNRLSSENTATMEDCARILNGTDGPHDRRTPAMPGGVTEAGQVFA